MGTTDWTAEKVVLEEVERLAYAYDDARSQALAEGLTEEQAAERNAALYEEFMTARKKASEYVVKDEFDQIYNREGSAQMNATTSADATTYYISLPSNRLELWCEMESGRMSDPVLRDFYSERDVVMEERRMRKDNSPIGQLWEVTMATAFTAHPYGYPVIGWEEDIRNLKATEADRFYLTHYTPDRAVGVLVGDLDIEKTRQLLRESFGRIPAKPEWHERPRIAVEPAQRGERRAELELAAAPALMMGWHKPCAPAIDDVRSEVLAMVLSGGRSARWFETFIKERRIAAQFYTFTGPGDRQPNLLMIYATPAGETTLEALEAAIDEEVTRLHEELIPEEELARAKKVIRADTLRGFETNMGLARMLAETTQLADDPYYLTRRLEQIEAVTAEDLQAFARSYLVRQNRSVATLVPPLPDAEQ